MRESTLYHIDRTPRRQEALPITDAKSSFHSKIVGIISDRARRVKDAARLLRAISSTIAIPDLSSSLSLSDGFPPLVALMP